MELCLSPINGGRARASSSSSFSFYDFFAFSLLRFIVYCNIVDVNFRMQFLEICRVVAILVDETSSFPKNLGFPEQSPVREAKHEQIARGAFSARRRYA
ncbi:Protein IRX15-LIKE [Senna tora]|uniref:Protein IRX15-LIKE n=1 Tax=Senna tora TaxID=362788 RepID=A0A834WI25_9FABA|nr:Protein IRX15-LIKE [Senna tora]